MKSAGATRQGDTILAVEGLSVRLPEGADRPYAVESVSFALRRGEILCLVGESGSGKSVTAQAIMGLLPSHLPVSAGAVHYAGGNLLRQSAASLEAICGNHLAMIFQEPSAALNPVFRVGRQIDETLRIHGDFSAVERQERVLALLEEVRLPDPKRIVRAYPHQLSGGQCQRVMIAIALALNPDVLIADEPTTALDVTTQAQILRLIKDLQTTHEAGIVFITHDFGVVADIADRVAVMQQGRLVELGKAEDVLNHPRDPYTRRLISAVPKFTTENSRSQQSGEVVLSVKGLVKRYRRSAGFLRRKTALLGAEEVSLELRRGETLGLVGESGSGKSTVAQCLLRLTGIDGGQVQLHGQDIAQMPEARLRPLRKSIQIVFQDPSTALNPRQRVGNALAEGPIIHGQAREPAMQRASELMRLVGLDPSAMDRYPHQFSGGQRQRLCIARALALQPDVLVADEPVSSLDVSVQAQILALLTEIQAKLHLAMLFITHDLRVAAQICDHVAVMRQGQIVEQGPTGNIFTKPQHPYTRELLASVPGRHWIGLEAIPE